MPHSSKDSTTGKHVQSCHVIFGDCRHHFRSCSNVPYGLRTFLIAFLVVLWSKESLREFPGRLKHFARNFLKLAYSHRFLIWTRSFSSKSTLFRNFRTSWHQLAWIFWVKKYWLSLQPDPLNLRCLLINLSSPDCWFYPLRRIPQYRWPPCHHETTSFRESPPK